MNTYNIRRRIDIDMGGKNSVITHKDYINFNESQDGSNKPINLYYGVLGTGCPDGLLGEYGDKSFEEYYFLEKTKNPLTGEEETEKLQIIYVEHV